MNTVTSFVRKTNKPLDKYTARGTQWDIRGATGFKIMGGGINMGVYYVLL